MRTPQSQKATCKALVPNHIKPGGWSTLNKKSASLFTLLEVQIMAVGGIDSSVALMLEENGVTENFIFHVIAEKLGLTEETALVPGKQDSEKNQG